MIPLIGGAFNLFVNSVNVLGIAGAAGTGYALGRKYGRKMCEFADNLETSFTSSIHNHDK